MQKTGPRVLDQALRFKFTVLDQTLTQTLSCSARTNSTMDIPLLLSFLFAEYLSFLFASLFLKFCRFK